MIKPYIMLLGSLMVAAAFQALPPLHVDGPDLKTPDGKTVILRGCNVGNWFMIEHWIWDEQQPDNSSHDQYELENLLTKRFGASEKDRLMDLYRDSWITDRDFDIIKSFRFNVVRIPLNYRMFESDDNPFHLTQQPWKWTDKAVEMAAKHGLYVILDMHGVQGGQNPYDHSGRANQNKLWTTPEDQERMAWLWTEVAKHYRDNPAVVAYDLFNEPYGGKKAQIRTQWEKTYNAVRTVDKEKLIYAMGLYGSYNMWGNPKDNGWHNMGIEMHYYPGLFGNGPGTLATNARFLNYIKTVVAPAVKPYDVPFLIGEMNVVFNAAGGAETMRRTYDLYAQNGWGTTMWSYKVLSRRGGMDDDGWGMVTNRDPIPRIDFATSSEPEIEAFFKSQATMAYTINEPLKDGMVPEHVDLPPMEIPPTRTTAPQGDYPGWTLSDVGDTLKGGFEKTAEGFNLYGGGADIWGEEDAFRYLQQQVKGDFELNVTVNSEEDLGEYCKAGLMIRDSLKPNSAFAMISTFPSGEVQSSVRTGTEADAQGSTAKQIGFPMEMKVSRRAGTWSVEARRVGDANWTEMALPAVPNMGDQVYVGPIALSHDNTQLIKVSYSNLKLTTNMEQK